MLALLFAAFFAVLYFAIRWWRERYERAARELLRPKSIPVSRRSLLARNGVLRSGWRGATKTNLWIALPLGVLGGATSVFYFHKSPVFGLAFGVALPFLITLYLNRRYQRAYREDVKKALAYAGAVFREGGTVEQWVREVVERLEGPLRQEFAFAAAGLSQQGVAPFLRQMAETSPDPMFRIAMAGIYDNYQSTGDLRLFIIGVLDSLKRQEHLERSLQNHMRQFTSMFAIPLLFPAFMYMLFQPVIDAILAQSVVANIVLAIAIAGYAGLAFLAYQATKPKML